MKWCRYLYEGTAHGGVIEDVTSSGLGTLSNPVTEERLTKEDSAL